MDYKPKLLTIRMMGEDVLREKARPVRKKEIKNEEFQRFIEDLKYTMLTKDGGGLAAPQVGRSKRVFVVNTPDISNSKDILVMVNPEITFESDKKKRDFDGCLSIPDLYGFTSRPKKLKIKFLDQEGEEHEEEYKDFAARAIHHEYDHLDGVLWIDRVDDNRDIYYKDVFITKFR
jgi:peptide deformylase